jgi:hypothetical protein
LPNLVTLTAMDDICRRSAIKRPDSVTADRQSIRFFIEAKTKKKLEKMSIEKKNCTGEFLDDGQGSIL